MTSAYDDADRRRHRRRWTPSPRPPRSTDRPARPRRRAATTSPTARRCAGSPACPPSSRTSPRSSTGSCAWSGSCWSACGPRARRRTPRTRWPSWPRWPRPPGRRCSRALIQRRDRPDPATYIGSGKARELRDIVVASGADTVICDGELTPGQLRQLEDVVKVKVIDRTALILDIFAQHAKSREGKAQVALAQMEYMLPRLRGWGESMSRQAGGGRRLGVRRRGHPRPRRDEDRDRPPADPHQDGQAAPRDHRDEDGPRHQAAGARAATRCRRWPSPATPTPASRRCSTGSPAPACWSRTRCSRPWTRRCAGPRPRTAATYTLADTVGFVRHLPHQLVEAFRSTLEEVADADLILHVVDGSDADPEAQLAAVRAVLADVDAQDVPELVVINKADLADPLVVDRLRRREKHSVVVSARTGEGIDELRPLIARELPRPAVDGRRAAAVRPRRPGVPGARRGRGARAGAPRRRHLGARPGDRRAGR